MYELFGVWTSELRGGFSFGGDALEPEAAPEGEAEI